MRDHSEPPAATMTGLSSLIELATQKRLELFFRSGQGYVACLRGAPAAGLNPLGIQARAEELIVGALVHSPREGRLYAWPGGPQATHRPGHAF